MFDMPEGMTPPLPNGGNILRPDPGRASAGLAAGAALVADEAAAARAAEAAAGAAFDAGNEPLARAAAAGAAELARQMAHAETRLARLAADNAETDPEVAVVSRAAAVRRSLFRIGVFAVAVLGAAAMVANDINALAEAVIASGRFSFTGETGTDRLLAGLLFLTPVLLVTWVGVTAWGTLRTDAERRRRHEALVRLVKLLGWALLPVIGLLLGPSVFPHHADGLAGGGGWVAATVAALEELSPVLGALLLVLLVALSMTGITALVGGAMIEHDRTRVVAVRAHEVHAWREAEIDRLHARLARLATERARLEGIVSAVAAARAASIAEAVAEMRQRRAAAVLAAANPSAGRLAVLDGGRRR